VGLSKTLATWVAGRLRTRQIVTEGRWRGEMGHTACGFCPTCDLSWSDVEDIRIPIRCPRCGDTPIEGRNPYGD
jgi:hypothetical protein